MSRACRKSDFTERGPVPAAAAAIAEQVGQPATVHYAHARQIRAAIPAAIRSAATAPERALPVVLASLLSAEPTVAERQRALLAQEYDPAVLEAMTIAQHELHILSPHLRLPAVQLLFPTLRRLTIVDRQTLVRVVDELSRVDARIDVFECALGALLATDLRVELEGRRARVGGDSIASHAGPLATVFATLASKGASDVTAARRAYEAGMASVFPRERPAFALAADWAAEFVGALKPLESLHPYAKRVVVEGLVKTIAHDDRLSVAEAELLRTVCAIMRCHCRRCCHSFRGNEK